MALMLAPAPLTPTVRRLRRMTMEQAKLLLRIGGAASLAAGVLCLPVGYGVNPKRDLSAFSNLADMGIFVTSGLIMVAIGAVLLLGSWLLPGKEPEDVA